MRAASPPGSSSHFQSMITQGGSKHVEHVEQLLDPKFCCKTFIAIVSLNPHNDPGKRFNFNSHITYEGYKVADTVNILERSHM